MRQKQISVDLVVKIIDYQDKDEERVYALVKAQFGVEIKSLFTYDEVGTAFRMNSLQQ